IGGLSMGGFGAYDLARLRPGTFCAVGADSAALWREGGETAPGAFDDGEDFSRNDVIGAARSGASTYGRARLWLDVGASDPFRSADTELVQVLRDHGRSVSFHVWPGGHEECYWDSHWGAYLDFYAAALAAWRLEGRGTLSAWRQTGRRSPTSSGARRARRCTPTRRYWASWPSRWRRRSPSSSTPRCASARAAGRRCRCRRRTARALSSRCSTCTHTRPCSSTATAARRASASRAALSARSRVSCSPLRTGSWVRSRSTRPRRRSRGPSRSTPTSSTAPTCPSRSSATSPRPP